MGAFNSILKGDGEFIRVNKFDLSKLDQNQQFNDKFEIVKASDYNSILEEAMKTPEAKENWNAKIQRDELFKGHGYKDGEIITYSTTGTEITDLTSSAQYRALVVDNDHFRLAQAGVGRTLTSDYDNGTCVKFTGVGLGTHIFNYQPISVAIEGDIGISSAVAQMKAHASMKASGLPEGASTDGLLRQAKGSVLNKTTKMLQDLDMNASQLDFRDREIQQGMVMAW